jgi:predicted lipoprotein with Yx(FWY)xxD motif/cytochrome c5
MNHWRYGAVATISLVLLTYAWAGHEHGVSVQTGRHATHGIHLIDGDGKALYLFLPDAQGASTCYDACAENWPPLLAVDRQHLNLSGDVRVDWIALHERTDGTLQVTYNGWPLYRFARDVAPGDAAGHARNDAWFLVGYRGAAVGTEPPAVADEPADDAFTAKMAAGQPLFASNCSGCHGGQGQGGAAPALDGRPRVQQKLVVINTILHGVPGYMPGFGAGLSDDEVAALATYVRNSWSNSFGPVDAEEVVRYR